MHSNCANFYYKMENYERVMGEAKIAAEFN